MTRGAGIGQVAIPVLVSPSAVENIGIPAAIAVDAGIAPRPVENYMCRLNYTPLSRL